MNTSIGHLVKVSLLTLLTIIGFDVFLHAGILSPLYSNAGPFLLTPQESFRRIPLGYLSFLVLIVLLLWLMLRLHIQGWRKGFFFGLVFGALVWGSLVLGLFSISTASPALLIGWFLGQTAESGLGGMVIGSGLATNRLRPLLIKVLIFFAAAVVLAIVIQNVLSSD